MATTYLALSKYYRTFNGLFIKHFPQPFFHSISVSIMEPTYRKIAPNSWQPHNTVSFLEIYSLFKIIYIFSNMMFNDILFSIMYLLFNKFTFS